jgi:hypothetical protein
MIPLLTLLAGWILGCLTTYVATRNLIRRPKHDTTAKVYFDMFATMPDTPRAELLEQSRR